MGKYCFGCVLLAEGNEFTSDPMPKERVPNSSVLSPTLKSYKVCKMTVCNMGKYCTLSLYGIKRDTFMYKRIQ